MTDKKILTQKGQCTQKNIISAAMAMIREKGFDETTIRAVCAKAKIGLGTFYHYFHSKDEVLMAYIDEENIDLFSFYTHADKTSYKNAILALANHYLDMYFFKGPKLVSQVYSMLIFSGIDSRQIHENAFGRIVSEAFITGQQNGEFLKQLSVDIFRNMVLGEWFYFTSLWCNAPDTFNIHEEVERNFTQLLDLVSDPAKPDEVLRKRSTLGNGNQ